MAEQYHKVYARIWENPAFRSYSDDGRLGPTPDYWDEDRPEGCKCGDVIVVQVPMNAMPENCVVHGTLIPVTVIRPWDPNKDPF